MATSYRAGHITENLGGGSHEVGGPKRSPSGTRSTALRGFLPTPDPLTELPAEFSAWDRVASDLPKLLVSDRARRVLSALPRAPVNQLRGASALRRAMMLLSFFGHAYVWGGASPARTIPRAIAVPWWEVSRRLGRPPVLSYASYALDNWRRLDPHGPVGLGNLVLLQNFLGGADEEWFVAVHVEVEAAAGPAIRCLAPLLDAAARGQVSSTLRHLTTIAVRIEEMSRVLRRMPEFCDPYIYFHRVRPYIHGWRDHPGLPGGVMYEGVAAYQGAPQRFRGETGAQSSVVPALDLALGIEHAPGPLRHYLDQMREYMPPEHRRFLLQIELRDAARRSLRELARESREVGQSYEECIAQLWKFRATHLELAMRYVGAQGSENPSNPSFVGTGGTPFSAYLRKHQDETRVR